MIRGVLLDLAGVVYQGDQVLPGAIEAVARFHAAKLPLRWSAVELETEPLGRLRINIRDPLKRKRIISYLETLK